MHLSQEERAILEGARGEAAAMAMRILARVATLMGAERLIPITAAHIDGCLYHGDGGVEFAERLVAGKAAVQVPTTLNVGALDLLHPQRVRGEPHRLRMARRQMDAYVRLGCRPTWTCAPYQAGHRPGIGEHVAWGESNAVAFVNSVLGARTDRYGDYLDICCALTGRAPNTGLHLEENRRATVVVDTGRLSRSLVQSDVFYPVLGTWLGRAVGSQVAVIDGLPPGVSEDQLKALGTAASSTGAVGLFHVAGVTPEAANVETALSGRAPERVADVTAAMLRESRDRLSTRRTGQIDAVAVGCPHFSLDEFAQLERLVSGRQFAVPFHVCAGRDVLATLEGQDRLRPMIEAGIEIVADTCVVVAAILPERGGVLMTNSGKLAHYAPANTGYDVAYGTLADCVASAETGRLHSDESVWE